MKTPWPRLLAAFAVLAGASGCGDGASSDGATGSGATPGVVEASSERVHEVCAACHTYPPPESLPRRVWKVEVERGFDFLHKSNLSLVAPPVADVVAYYRNRAPERLPIPPIEYAKTPVPVRFERAAGWGEARGTEDPPPPNASNVSVVRLLDERRPDVLVCDMGRDAGEGGVLVLQPYVESPRWRLLAPAQNPAHAEVVDLDGDGVRDVIVACLGRANPSDDAAGSVLWLRGRGDGTFERHVLIEGIGRVADVRAAPFVKAGRMDLVVAEFGWRARGRIHLLENRTTDWSRPSFVSKTIDDRHGTIHVPVVDLNADGRPDFIACISQEHEAIVAFVNEGDGSFAKRTLFVGPHPTYGSSGIDLVDMNLDGRVDVLYTNGDALDPPFEKKPYHGIQWLENPGDASTPWKRHEVGPMPGVHRALATDLTGDGLLDIVAVAFLPELFFPAAVREDADAVVLFQQDASGRFQRHRLEKTTCQHATCALGDVTGTGRLDLVVGNLSFGPRGARGVTLWRNLGAP